MSTALYRRYRPDTFADVIGQEHVTAPLIAAIDSGRINHAYLFSGPRGCGKTTSARILARCLNCAEGPTSTPCGNCESCVELATGGSGSLDVVEMDAASHGGVDDARDLRERAVFAPARDRYKVFIIDEAHMVTPQGFNALLKLVEEPPEHVKFIFATTEPEKVIGTIRSRTHHYPFRLVPPESLSQYMEKLAAQERITIEQGVLPLVVRAGGGSVRDSLSVLDQVMAGADDAVVTYDRSVALLGYTPGGLLDDVVGAVAARDGASLFRVIGRVINSGHSPRRFVEDLLERLRDLIVVLAAGDDAAGLLPDVAPDQLQRMQHQAHHLQLAGASRAADLVNNALTAMVGATAPKLQLELLAARLLIPSADIDAGIPSRLEALESRISSGVIASRMALATTTTPQQPGATQPSDAAPSADAPITPSSASSVGRSTAAGRGSSNEPEEEPTRLDPTRDELDQRTKHLSAAATDMPNTDVSDNPASPSVLDPSSATHPMGEVDVAAEPKGQVDVEAIQAVEGASTEVARTDQPAAADPDMKAAALESSTTNRSQQPDRVVEVSKQAAAEMPVEKELHVESGAPEANVAMTTEVLRGRWAEVMDTLAQVRRATWALVSQDAQVIRLEGASLTIGFSTPGLATAFQSGQHTQNLSTAVEKSLGITVTITTQVGDTAQVSGVRNQSRGKDRGGVAPGNPPSGAAQPHRTDAADWPGGGHSEAGQDGITQDRIAQDGAAQRNRAKDSSQGRPAGTGSNGHRTGGTQGRQRGTGSTGKADGSGRSPEAADESDRGETAPASQIPVAEAPSWLDEEEDGWGPVASIPQTPPARGAAKSTPKLKAGSRSVSVHSDAGAAPGSSGTNPHSTPADPRSSDSSASGASVTTGSEKADVTRVERTVVPNTVAPPTSAEAQSSPARRVEAAAMTTAPVSQRITRASVPPWEDEPQTQPQAVRDALTPHDEGARDDETSPDDPDFDDPNQSMVGVPVVAKILGGTVIDEIIHEGDPI